jgi:hypothetical protein
MTKVIELPADGDERWSLRETDNSKPIPVIFVRSHNSEGIFPTSLARMLASALEPE